MMGLIIKNIYTMRVLDTCDLDNIFDDDFRKTTDVSVGDRFNTDFSLHQ